MERVKLMRTNTNLFCI